MITDRLGNDPTNPEPCLITCAGSSGYGKTKWNGTKPGKVQTIVDISKCNFVKPPILTTSMDGEKNYDMVVGGSSPSGVRKDKFGINILGNVMTAWYQLPKWEWIPTAKRAVEWKWSINWIAVGYVC